jgi:hypothetical protein
VDKGGSGFNPLNDNRYYRPLAGHFKTAHCVDGLNGVALYICTTRSYCCPCCHLRTYLAVVIVLVVAFVIVYAFVVVIDVN